jgi:hypothetical protein
LDEESPLTLVYMNNHWQGQAASTARQLRMLMEGEETDGTTPKPTCSLTKTK